METQLDEWDPMREHFHDRRLNSYRSGMGHDLRVTRQEAPGGNKNVTLYIRGVPFGLSPAALEKLFSDHGGRVIQAKIPQNQDASRHSANYAFVIMADATGAQRAIENLDGFRIKEHTLSVQVALSKEEMARRDERRKREEDFMKKLNLSISWQEGKESEANSSVSEAGEGVIGRDRGAVLEDKQLSTSSSDDSTMQNGDGLHGPLSSIPANQNKKQSDKSKSQKKQQPGKGMGRGDQLGSKSGPAGVGGHRQASTQAMFLMGRGQALNRLLNDSEAGFRRTQFDERSVTGTESGRSECITCGTETTSRCKCCKTPYCSRECQVKDWPEHSKICMDIRNKLHPIPQFSGQQPLVDLSNFDVDIDDGFMANHKEFFNSILRAANEGSDSSSDRETFKGSYTKKSHETPKTSDQKQKGGLKPSTQTKRALQKKQKRGPSSSSSSQNSGEVTAVGSVYLDRKTLPPQPQSRPQENNRSLQTQYPQQEKKMPPGPPGVKQQQSLLPTPVYPGAPPGRMFPTGNRFQGPRPNNGLGQGSRWSGQPARGGGLQNEQPPRQDSTMYRHDDQKHSDPAEGSIGCGAKNDRGRGQQKKFTCHRCGEKGHFIKDCPKQAGRGSSDRRAGSRSFQQTLEKGRAHVAEEEKKSSPSAAVSQATDAGMAATQSLTLNESVAVVHFESPHCIFIQKVDDVLGLANASEQLQKNQLTVLGTPKKGDIVFCDYLGELYRARIVEVKGSLAKIFYIDYGNWEERQTSCLLSLPEELKDMPGIAIKCSLDVSPADGSVVWPESLCAELRTVLVDSELFLATPLRRYLDTYIVTLVRNSDQLDVTRHLIEKGLARASVDELSLMSPGPAGDAPKRFMAADLGNVAEELRVGERKEIFCADISNRLDLSMQIPEKMDTMQSFNASLHKAYSTLPPPATPYLPVLGELVAARYSNDVLWYRAEVKAIVDEQVAVHFIDFGNMEVRPITDIRALQEEYARLPAQSFRCAVVGLNLSADKEWTAEQLMQFMTCIKLYMQEDSMKCIAEIKSKEPGVVWVDIVHEEREQTLAEVLPSVLEASLLPQPIQPVAAPLTPPVADRASMFASQPCASAAATAVDVPTGMTSEAAATNFSGESSTLSSAILPLDTWLSCGIQEIYSCSCFYVNNMNEVTELDALREGLNEPCFTPAGENARKAVKPGDIILAQFSADGEWYRGRVESLSDNGVTCHVLFVDYGNAEEKPVASLRVVPTRFLQLPAQGICCSLSGATASHSSDMDDLFRKFCLQAIVKVKAIRCTEGVYEVVIHTSDGKSVTELFNQTMGQTGQSATPTGQSVSPTSQSGSPVDLAVPSAEQPVIPATRPVTVEGRPVTPADPPMTPASWPVTPADQLVTPASRSVTPTSRPVTPEGQPVTPEDQPSRGSDTAASLDGPVMLDQLQIISPNSEEQEVIISHAVSPSIFYCQPVTIAADLVGLTAKLKACESAEPVSAVPHVGEVLCSKFDGGWYRSVVMDMADTTVSVHFIDYGNDAQVEMSELRPIPHDLSMEYCVGCFRCSLHGIHAPKGGWSDNALDYLKLLLNIPLVLKAVGESQGSHSVTINFNGINLAQDLVNSELAVELPDSTAGEQIPPESSESIKTTVVEDVRQDRIMLATLRTVVLDTLEQEVVLVHSVSPSEFYCQLKTVAIAQQELDAQLTALCSVAKPVRGGPQVGEVLCAMFDGGWYRCVVNEVLGDQVSVHFIDYGNDALIKVSELWPAPRDLCMKYPVGCFKCSLHGIRMPEGGWSEEAITKQNRLVHSLIMLKAEGQSQGTWSVTIRTDGQDVAQDHVNSGLAVHAKPEPKQEPQLQTVQRQKTREELEREIEELQRLLQAKK